MGLGYGVSEEDFMSSSSGDSCVPETELDKFMNEIKDKSQNTKKTYKRQYTNLVQAINGKDISDESEVKLLEAIASADKNNKTATRQSLINIAILVRRMEKVPFDKLDEERTKNKERLSEETGVRNSNLELPSMKTLEDYRDKLFTDAKFKEFLINYFLIEFNVRNLDMVFDIVKLKRLTDDQSKNFIWLDRNKAIYYRNVFKTVKSLKPNDEKNEKYNPKYHEITDERVRLALKMVGNSWDYTADNIGYWVRKATYDKLGEGNYFKIAVDHHKGNLRTLEKMAWNRGTSLEMMFTNYNTEPLD